MPTTIRLATSLVALLAIIAACSTVPGLGVADRTFLSVDVTEGGAPKALVPGTRIELGFEGAALNVRAGCNTIGADYRIDGGRLILEDLRMTAMGCDQPRSGQDAWLSEFLGSRPAVSLVGNDLVLQNETTTIRLLDRETADPDRNLVGPLWTVESIITGDTVASAPADATATIRFHDDGTVDVSPGCNRGGGTWTLRGAGLDVTGLVITKMACQGPGGQLEGAVLQVLNAGMLNASIEADVLTLQGAGGGLQLRAR